MGKIIGMVKGIFTHWNKPANGRYVANKEIAAYSVGGMGVQFLAAIVGQVGLSANCLLLGSIYGLTAFELTTLLTINTIVTLLSIPLKSYWNDNVGGNQGKARPFLLWLGLPSAILFGVIPFVPLTWPHMTILVLIGGLYILGNLAYQMFFGMYIQLSQLITPNSTERADIISVSSLVYSFAPTVTGALFPLISKAFGEGSTGQLNIRFYQTIFPIFAILGVAVSLFAYFGTKERIIVPKTYKRKVKFKDGFKQIATNKYFWITNISSWVLFARGAVSACMGWAYVYILQDSGIQALVTLIMGTASGIGMLLAPLFVRKFGKKNTVIYANLLSAVASGVLIFVPSSFVAFSVACYVMFFAAAIQIITGPAMGADALDYQQWKTGSRLEGFAGNIGMIGTIIALGTNYIVPAIYQSNGLTNNYNVLYDESIRNPIFRKLAILSTVATVLYIIPYFFWDLSEKKHMTMMEDLKLRALEENKNAGLDDGSFLSSDEKLNTEVLSAEEINAELAKEGLEIDKTIANNDTAKDSATEGKVANNDFDDSEKRSENEKKTNALAQESEKEIDNTIATNATEKVELTATTLAQESDKPTLAQEEKENK